MRVLLCFLVLLLLSPTAMHAQSAAPFTGIFDGSQPYLSAEARPNSLVLLPPPPAEGSRLFAADRECHDQAQLLRGTPRWRLAISDANFRFPDAADVFSCALNSPITKKDTPRLYLLLERSQRDASRSTGAAKRHYRRTRPFAALNESTCTPEYEMSLSMNGSYPSGHAAVGFAWALILSELSPEHTDAILARGREFGQSRVVCNVHWQSDVIEGQLMGAATVARLHADPAFLGDLEAAKAELRSARAKGLKPARDCKSEAAALAVKIRDARIK